VWPVDVSGISSSAVRELSDIVPGMGLFGRGESMASEDRMLYIVGGFEQQPFVLPYDTFIGATITRQLDQCGFEARRPEGVPDDAIASPDLRERLGGKVLSQETFFFHLKFERRDFLRSKVLEQLMQRINPYLTYAGADHDTRFRDEFAPPHLR
jgi:hypothetical protein